MSLIVRHATQVTVPDNANYPVASGEWNADHTVDDSNFATRTGPLALGTIAALPFVGSPLTGNINLDPTVVTIDAGAGNKGSPGLALLPDGRLLLAYRHATGHGSPWDGDLRVRYSSDLGLTWTAAATLLTHSTGPTVDYRDPQVTVLADGRVMIAFYTHNGTIANAVKIITSEDNGVTWSTPVTITTPYTQTVATEGKVVELASGTLLLPIYGNYTGDNPDITTAAVVKSDNGGTSWGSQVTMASGANFNEATIVILPDGNLLSLIRNEDDASIYKVTSTNDGVTWSTPSLSFAGSARPELLVLASGGVCIFYRNPANGLPVYRTSWDDGVTWSALTQFGASTYYYGAAIQLAGGLVALALSLQPSDTDADLYLRYLGDGIGTTPTGFQTGAGGSGTGFPASPFTGQRFFLNSAGVEFYWDGTRWLSVNLYQGSFSQGDALTPFTTSGTANHRAATWSNLFDTWIVDLMILMRVASPNDGTFYWSAALRKITSPGVATTITTVTTAAQAALAWNNQRVSINALLGVTHTQLDIVYTKVGTPGSVNATAFYTYRLVG